MNATNVAISLVSVEIAEWTDATVAIPGIDDHHQVLAAVGRPEDDVTDRPVIGVKDQPLDVRQVMDVTGLGQDQKVQESVTDHQVSNDRNLQAIAEEATLDLRVLTAQEVVGPVIRNLRGVAVVLNKLCSYVLRKKVGAIYMSLWQVVVYPLFD